MEVLFTTRQKKTPIGELIKIFQRSDFSHCCLVFERKGIKYIAEATIIYGVRIVTHESFMKVNKIIDKVPVKDEKAGEEALDYCYGNLGDGYANKSLIGILFSRYNVGKDGENQFICSELLARAFKLKHKSLDHITVTEFKKLIEV